MAAEDGGCRRGGGSRWWWVAVIVVDGGGDDNGGWWSSSVAGGGSGGWWWWSAEGGSSDRGGGGLRWRVAAMVVDGGGGGRRYSSGAKNGQNTALDGLEWNGLCMEGKKRRNKEVRAPPSLNQSGFQYSTLPFGQSSGIQGDGYDDRYEEDFRGYEEEGFSFGGDGGHLGPQGGAGQQSQPIQQFQDMGRLPVGVQHIRPQGPQLQRPTPLHQVRPQITQPQFQRPIQ
ncbi:heterogeneous nuclear ribonucleoprotein A1, A2/B1 homolog [Helianthus annuus]|uniref:heterogeneous nuclear ribonucleoprotein A1, A2/B1 homolog n=1 Tax=Helianthus annuus TaxID=4232 RepID=UPI000B8F6630|nr:heterogeneous nuclear ribonucleoprotein A1, A2/B1 homolog [Helianthus annuus]